MLVPTVSSLTFGVEDREIIMTRSNQTHVLVVDDEADLCELLSEALSASGMTVSTACNAADAITIANRDKPDFVVTDLCLGSSSGLAVLDSLSSQGSEIPAVVITGHGDSATLTEASKRRPVELMTKPLNLEHLTQTINNELDRRKGLHRAERRTQKLRQLARKSNIERKKISKQLSTTCSELTEAYRTLSGQLAIQNVVMGYQGELVLARSDDEVFRNFFRVFVKQSGQVFGIAMVCDGDAQLQVAGRFGVPNPDGLQFCRSLAEPMIESLLVHPQCLLLDAGDNMDQFDESLHRKLPGISLLAVPLIPREGEMIGAVILYRKGEQPFTDADLSLAELIARPTALAVQRND
jgi:ActR/RegA family two-component response regulator